MFGDPPPRSGFKEDFSVRSERFAARHRNLPCTLLILLNMPIASRSETAAGHDDGGT
jgi:hypothetical protein